MKEFLSHRNVPFDVRLLTEPAHRRELQARGSRQAPLTLIDDEALWGFDRGGLADALGRHGFAREPASAASSRAAAAGLPLRDAIAVTSFLGDGLTLLARGSGGYVADTLERSTIRIDGHPIVAEVCERHGTVATVNYEAGSVTFLSRDGNYLHGSLERSTLETGKLPLCAVAHPRAPLLYVSNSESNSLTAFDPASGRHAFGSRERSTFALPGQPGVMAIQAELDLLFVRLREGRVMAFRATSMQPAWGSTEQSTLEVGRGRSIALSHDQLLLYVPEAAAIGAPADGLTVYEASTGRRLTDRQPAASTPFSIAAHPARPIVYLSCFGPRLVEFRDGATGGYLRGTPEASSIAVGSGARAMLVDPHDDTLYVTCYDEDAVYRFDAVSGAPKSKVALGRGPRGLALLPA